MPTDNPASRHKVSVDGGKKASGCFRQALKSDPKLIAAQIGLAFCLDGAGKAAKRSTRRRN